MKNPLVNLLFLLASLVRPAFSLPVGVSPLRFVASLLPLVLLVQPVAAQQQSFFRGAWDCQPPVFEPNQLHCRADCSANPAAFAQAGVLGCHLGQSQDQCIQGFGEQAGPLCCVGYASFSECQNAAAGITTPDPVAPTNPDPVSPDPTPDPVSPPRIANARDDNAGESTKGGALPLIAGGLFLAHYIISNATGGDDDGAGLLPEGLELDSHSVISHRNGVSGAHAGLTARYGDWLARISSRHSGASWARPDASLQWSYRSSSWEFRAYASQSGGAWDRPRAQIEWGWRF